MTSQTVIAVCLVAIAVSSVAHVVRQFVGDLEEMRRQHSRLQLTTQKLVEVNRSINATVDSLRSDSVRTRAALDTAHADLMQLFDHTGAKRERL